MAEKVIVQFQNKINGISRELEVPTNITANDLIVALNEIFNLKMDLNNMYNCYLVSENPIAYLHGKKLLSEYGLRNGSRIIFSRR